ncbi:ATP-binding protein [Bacteroides ovatus]|nr:ATP-binding protein [Bacteroides ovatus]
MPRWRKKNSPKKRTRNSHKPNFQFFANISHEFRTPLTLIISQIESLMQSSGSNSPFLRTRLQKIYKNTFQFRELISELLDFRKMEYGKLNLHVCQQDMVLYLKQIHSDFMDQAQLQNIYFVFHSGVESAMCWCDGRQLRKVFSNLLSNAFKHTPEKGKIELQIHETATTLEIKVMDTGSGIPSEALPHIFDRFYQVDATVASPGSGIGLALSKGLVELHHGEIKVQSAMQYGTIFTVILPKDNPFQNDSYVTFVDSDASCLESTIPFAKDADVENNMAETPYDASDAQGDLTSKDSILVVEDNEDLLQILTSLLSPLYRVVIAMNGKEGLQKTIEEHPDLILSDIMMPEMSGIEMCSKIKGNFDLCHISVILLTALTSENNKMEGLQCGADDYIEKPFNNKMLLGHIANIIRNRKLLEAEIQQRFIRYRRDRSRNSGIGFEPYRR